MGIDTKEVTIAESQQSLREAEKCLKQMEIETMPFPENIRKEMNQKIKKHRADYEESRRKFMVAEENYLDEKGKNSLMGSRNENNDSRQKRPETLIDTQNRKLEDAKKTGFTTLEIASATNTELNRQTEVLLRNQERLRQMDGDLAESNSLIKSMQRQVMKNKLTFYGIVAIILLAIGIIIYSYC